VVVAAPNPILERIRRETRALHRALERDSRLLRPDVTITDYRWYLVKLLGFHAPLELKLDALALRHGLDRARRGRAKTPLLVQDLATLGMRPANATAVPWAPRLPNPLGIGGLLGCDYVLEGATLGGKLLLRRLAPRLSIVADACRYLDCYGDAVAERWHSFLTQFDGCLPARYEQDAAVEAARETFEALKDWLADGPPAPQPEAVHG
jgi:heme oxygenase